MLVLETGNIAGCFSKDVRNSLLGGLILFKYIASIFVFISLKGHFKEIYITLKSDKGVQ